MENRNLDCMNEVRKVFRIPLNENVSLSVNNSIQPVYEVKKRIANIVRSNSRATTGSSTVYTTPTDKDFYLTSAQFNYNCDAVCDGTTYILTVNIDGAGQNILILRKIATTAGSGGITCNFNTPIKIDRNSSISITQTFAAGNSAMAASITGYTEEYSQ